MNRRIEFLLVLLFLLIGAGLRIWDLTRLPPGLSNDELAYIRTTETVRQGDVAVYYQVGDGHGRTGLYAIGNALITEFVGDGLLGYRTYALWGGLLTLAALYALARRLFGPPVALVALGILSVNLRAILLARTATPEAFVPLYTVLTLWVLALAFNLRQTIRFRTPATLPFALLAVLLGVSGYLHYTALALGPVTALFFIHLLWTRQPLSRRVWSAAIFVLSLATVAAVPYLISTFRDPEASEPYILWAERPQSTGDGVDAVLRTIGGVIWQGDARITHNLPDAALVGPVTSILLIVGVAAALRRWREPRYTLILLVLAAGLATDAWVGTYPSFSANLVALPAVYILPGIGALALWRALRARGMQQAWQPVALLLGLILVANLITLRTRLFDTWHDHSQVTTAYHANLGYLAAYLDRTPDDLPVSMCSIPLREPNEVGLTPRQIFRLMMHRADMPIRYADCRGGLVLINAGAPMRFIFTDAANRELMPPELGDWLQDARPIPVEGLPDGTVLYLDVEARIEDAGGYWDTLSQALFMPDENGATHPAHLPVTLEQNLTFAGYEPRVFEGKPVPGGAPIVLVTYWRVDGKLPPDLGIFAHVLAYANPRLEPWAESNSIDVIPSELKQRDFFAQVSYIWLGEQLQPGQYTLTVGAYTDSVAVIENHLNVLDREMGGYPRGDRLLLGVIEVQPAPEPTGEANGDS